ncbi:MAG: MtrB/PioB family outer membrane beta-barrel protein [Vicinamibacterales bacterium]
MKRHTLLLVLLACGFLASAGTPAFAQQLPPDPVALPLPPATDGPAPTEWTAGNVDFLLLGREDVASSKFEEYRLVPKGISMPLFNLAGRRGNSNFAIFGQDISQKDQRYTGRAKTGWFGVVFDYNQIPHAMGNDAKTIHTETAPGVWSMNALTRKALGDAVDAVPASGRNYPFYSSLLASTIASAEHSNLDAMRKRTDVAVNLAGATSPFGLTFTYNYDIKTGYRGASAGDILGVVTSSVDVLEPLNEVTQDYGVRWNWNGAKGHVYTALNRNIYDDRVDALIVDNPFRATDLAYTSTAVPGGPAQARFSTPPDNAATRGAFGGQLKLAKQTRLTADIAFGQWTQNAPFLPYTINSAIFTPAGLPANSVSSLQQASLNGKITTASYNFTFVTRPVRPLTLRARYRNYAFKDKSNRYVITGDTSGSPDRSWTAADTPSAADPYGHVTANRVGATNGHFEAVASYDAGGLTLEGAYRNIQTTWDGRVGSSGSEGSENGYRMSAVFHGREWLDMRAHYDAAKRTVGGIEPGSVAALQGVMADHAERERTNIGLNVDIIPADLWGFTFGYSRRHDDYPNRPFKVAGDASTESGLLEASYDLYSVDFNFTPGARGEVALFYTYENIAETNQWVTLTSGALNNRLTYAPYDKGHTFGTNTVINLVPDKWALTFFAQHQKVDGFLDITAREAGSFYTPGRTTLIPLGQGGAADINDYDDMRQTTAVVDLRYTFAKAWRFSMGYAYDKFTTADAFSDGTTIFPQAVLFFLKQNDGNYSTSMAYTRLTYHF